MNKINIDPKVPISKPEPKIELYTDDEKIDEARKTNGIIPPNIIKRSLGILNLPSPSLDINQRNNESVAPIDIKNPLLASNVIGVKGIKKNSETNKVTRRVNNDNLLKNSTFLDSIFFDSS